MWFAESSVLHRADSGEASLEGDRETGRRLKEEMLLEVRRLMVLKDPQRSLVRQYSRSISPLLLDLADLACIRAGSSYTLHLVENLPDRLGQELHSPLHVLLLSPTEPK